MWLVWLAIFILFLLVVFIPLREGLTSKQLYDFQAIINSKTLSFDEKANAIYYNNEDADILDVPIIDIFKSSLTNEDKLIALQDYFVNIVNERNSSSFYKSVPNKISSEEFFKLNNMLNTEFENDTEKILQIDSIGIEEQTFNDIIKSTISDEAKISGDETYTGPTLSSLINETLYSTYLSIPSSSSSSKPTVVNQASKSITNTTNNATKSVKNAFSSKKKK
jgi:hypothetical protein